jgi:membrane protein implicated in regulation of membrane protease activity
MWIVIGLIALLIVIWVMIGFPVWQILVISALIGAFVYADSKNYQKKMEEEAKQNAQKGGKKKK